MGVVGVWVITAFIENRDALQLLTLVLALATAVILAHMAIQRIIAWRYTVLPGLILAEMILFYVMVVFIWDTSQPSARVTFYSSIIRLQTVLAALVFLVAYWRGKSHK